MGRLVGVSTFLICAWLAAAQTNPFDYKPYRTISDAGRVQSLAFCGDKRTAFAGGADGSLRLINIPDGTSRRVPLGSRPIASVDCSRDGLMGREPLPMGPFFCRALPARPKR